MADNQTNTITKLKSEIARHALLLISICVSVIMLAIFLLFQYFHLKILDLDKKWILLSGVPTLIGLFIGGYIKTFKGLGVELEAKLNEPLPLDIDSAKITVEKTSDIEKTPGNLTRIRESEKENTFTILRFVNGKKGYYKVSDFTEYLTYLTKLKFIEVTTEGGQFLVLVPREKIQNEQDKKDFIKYVENGSIEQQDSSFAYNSIITDHLYDTDTIIEAYRAINRSWQSRILKYPALPVLNEKNEMIGIVELQSLEAQIAKAVDKTLP